MSDTGDTRLRALIQRVLNLREERAAITSDIGDVLKEAKAAGYDSTKVTEVCRWLEKCDKNGRDAMVEAEAIFDLYREVAEGPAAPLAEIFPQARDKALVAMFTAPATEPAKVNAKTRILTAARAAAQLARKADRGEI